MSVVAVGKETDTSTVAWAATATWRGDLKLFARIAEKALEEVEKTGEPAVCKIEFAIRDDVESYASTVDLLERVPASTVRSFSSARIVVRGPALTVAVHFGRKKPHEEAAFECDLGVAIKVSSNGEADEQKVAAVRAAMGRLIGRGGFSWGAAPTEGPTEKEPDLEDTLSERWKVRQYWSQLIFLVVAVVILGLAYLVYTLVEPDPEDRPDGLLSSPLGTIGVLGVVQLVSLPLSTLIFPAIQIADVTPGRRIFQVIGRSGVITAAVGIAGAYLKAKVG